MSGEDKKSQVRGEEGGKNYTCTHTVVQAVPPLLYEHSYPIGYLISCDQSLNNTVGAGVILFCNLPLACDLHFVLALCLLLFH